MSLRNSLDLIRAVKPESGQLVLEAEIQAEQASSISAAEKKVIAALAAWRAAEGDEAKAAALAPARYAVWAYFVQRELIGFRGHADVIADLDIPPVVLNGLGETPKPWFRRRR